MNAKDSEVAIIKSKLVNQLEKVIDQFLPGGKYTGGRYVCGSINGGEGQSFSIQLAGANRGVWKDFSEDTHGDVLKIFYYHAGENYSSMMNLARSFLGMETAKPKVSFKRPTDKDMGEELSHIGDVFEYLTTERKIPEEILTACEVRQTKGDDGYIFLFRPAKKKEIVCLAKTVMLAREDGKKKEWSSKDGLWVLWGMHAAVDHTYESQENYLIITEGEIDAMSYMAEGFRAVSIPGGVQNLNWIELCFEWLSQFKTIYLSFDMDDKGSPAVEKVAARLGIDRCKVIELPKKDANKCLQDGISLRQYVESAKELKPDKLVSAFELREQAWERITRGRMEELGIPFMGWEGDESINFKLRERECTIYTGFPSHGKSNLLYQLTAYLIGEHKQKIAIASLEEPADKVLNVILFHLLAEALTDDTEETREKFEMAMKVIGNNLFIYHHVGIAPLKDIIAFSEFCVNRHGCQHFILDSVARTDLNIENNEDANAFMEAVIVSMNRTGAHYHMVAHSRKGQSGDFTSIPGKDEVKGSAQFGNLTFNVLTCWKNQKKYDILASGKSDMEDASNIRENWGDGKIRISKQKVGGMEGEYKIYYNPSNYRFRRSYHATDYPYFGSRDGSPF